MQAIENYIKDINYIKKNKKYEKNFAKKISNLVTYEYCPKGKAIFFAGDIADNFYIILEGNIGVVLADKVS